MELDLDTARAAFDASTDFTVGLEEEFALLDPASLETGAALRAAARRRRRRPAPGRVDLRRADLLRDRDPLGAGRGSGRRPRRPAGSPPAAVRAGRRPGAGARVRPGPIRARTTASSTIIQTEHYRRVEEGLKYVAWRNNTFSLHVHVGVRGRRSRGAGVRPAAAGAAGAARDLGQLAVPRRPGLGPAQRAHADFTKSFPRCGVPDAFGDWATFADYIDLLVATRSIVEYTQVWWSIRPHFSFGTVEVRICDAQSTAGESDAPRGADRRLRGPGGARRRRGRAARSTFPTG